MSKKRAYNSSYIEYGFSYITKNEEQSPQCVICAQVLAPSAMKPSFLKRHLTTKHPHMVGKDIGFFKRKEEGLKRTKLDSGGRLQQQSISALKASYLVSLRIAKEKKPHTIGEKLILPCCKDIVTAMFGEESAKKLDTIPLSDNTVQRRISDISGDIKDQVINEIKAAGAFAIQLDESTDIANMAQLLVFVRYVKDNRFKEEFLFCHPLSSTTTAEDIFRTVSTFFDDNGLQWENVSGITTDGAPAMLGCRSGFVTRVKAVNPVITSVHCMLHRQALAAKTLPAELKSVLDDAVSIVNYIKGSALATRTLRNLCQNLDSEQEVLLYHTEVRWLSRGNMLTRLFLMRAEIKEFFETDKKQRSKDYLGVICHEEWELYLAYLVGIFHRINVLNKSLQGRQGTIIDAMDKLRAFLLKINLWLDQINDGNFSAFDELCQLATTTAAHVENIARLAVQHLNALKEEVTRYFPELGESDAKMIRNPFLVDVNDVPARIQEQLIDLQTDSTAKDAFVEKKLVEFWCGMQASYPEVSSVAVKSLLVFPTTYLCESGFSALVQIKNKSRARLQVESDLRAALSQTLPRIDRLVASVQPQPSH